MKPVTQHNLPHRRGTSLAARVALATAIALAASSCGDGSGPRQNLDPGAGGVAFVEERACAECHEQAFQDWSGSHHDWALRPATSENVLADFDATNFTSFGVTSTFFRRGDRYFVNTEGPDGTLADFEIKYTFGYQPLQQYLIEFPGGRLQSLTIAWDTEHGRWFSLYADERIEADDPLHWTGRLQTWNQMCAECHSTNLRKNYDAARDAYTTEWAASNVGCQACHGPGEAHVAWARQRSQGQPGSGSDNGLVVAFRGGEPRFEVEQCARCHSRRSPISSDAALGRALLDDYEPALLREGLYHADGQILDEVYVYGSFVQSKMYHEGVRCSDCHNPHGARLHSEGNGVCTRCHQASPPEEFPTLASKEYDTPEHHHHPPGQGAQCVECHMPARTYMVVDPRGDHSFRIPRPDLTQTLGVPNACNGCHEDETPEWAAAAITRWYGPGQPPTWNYAEAIAAGRARSVGAEEKLTTLAADDAQPAIARATALELLRDYGPSSVEAAAALTRDSDPLVRANAVAGLAALPPADRLLAAAGLLSDEVRAVRLHAARVLASVPAEWFDAAQSQAFESAAEEFRAAQREIADTPGGRFNLAVFEEDLGNRGEAEQQYVKALEIESGFPAAVLNLSRLYSQTERNAAAERLLRASLAQHPREGELHYSLALLLAETDRLDEAAGHLETAAGLLPGRSRVRYNNGLALQHLGHREQAEAELQAAYRLDAQDPDILHALAIFYMQRQQWSHALPYARELQQLAPNAPGPRQLVDQIERQAGQ